MDQRCINPVKAKPKALKASAATSLGADYALLNKDSTIDLYSLNLVLDIQHKALQNLRPQRNGNHTSLQCADSSAGEMKSLFQDRM